MSVGERVKQLRLKKGWSQTQLAQEVTKRGGTLSQQNVANIEVGLVKEPKSLIWLAEALSVLPRWLVSGQGPVDAVIHGPDGGVTIVEAKAAPRRQIQFSPRTTVQVGANTRGMSAALDFQKLLEGDAQFAVGDADQIELIVGRKAPDQQAAAAIVQTDNLRPLYERGDILLFFAGHGLADPLNLPRRPVIVKVRNGPLYIKRLLPGTRKGRFHLVSPQSGAILPDQPVESVEPIELVKPKAA